MKSPSKLVVLITGCSSGIGAATAARLVRAGHTVYASARRIESLQSLREQGCKTISLDVTSEESCQNAVRAIELESGRIDILINNAGFSQSGALETLSIEQVRRQFETNCFGVLRLSQLVLPGMRARACGKIVNVGSIAGRLTFPGGGAYHASKHALEALCDALRFEVRGFGIDVILVQPGLIRSRFIETALEQVPSQTNASPYVDFHQKVAAFSSDAYDKGIWGWLAGESDDVAYVIEKAISKARPRSRYTVTVSATVLLFLRRILSDSWWDAMLRTMFPSPSLR